MKKTASKSQNVYNKVQYNSLYNTVQHNVIHYTICFLGNLSSPGVKTVLEIERYAQRLTRGYMGDGGSMRLHVMGSWFLYTSRVC